MDLRDLQKEQHGGNRYANHKGGHDCWECTPYLKDGIRNKTARNRVY